MISIVILTYNEEVNLPGCLESVAWCDDVVVFDSFSSDRTVDIAQTTGVRVVQHPFENYSAQREAARTLVTYKHPWLLFLDADERVDDTLKTEILELRDSPEPFAAYRMCGKVFFMGHWIRRSSLYPSWYTRLLWRDRCRFEPRTVHEHPTVDGQVGILSGHLPHHTFNKGFEEWFARHNRYSTLEAREDLHSLKTRAIAWRHLTSSDPVSRRRALKELSFRLPCRALLGFVYRFFLRGGFLDGSVGFTYCRLLYFYELMITLKMKEQQRRDLGLPL